MRIVFCAGLVNMGLAGSVPLLAVGLNVLESKAIWIANMGPLPILGILVMGIAIRLLMPTTFRRGILVALLFYLVWIIVGLIIAGVWYAMDGDFRF